MPGERDERRVALDQRLRAQRGRRTREQVAADVEAITGSRPALDAFLSAEATERLSRRYLNASSVSGVHRQLWTDDLAADVRAALTSAAETFSDTAGYWLHRWSQDAGAVHVPLSPMLRHAARTFTPGDYDLVLVSDNADDGIRLAWDHLPRGNEYELVRWGEFRRAT